MKRERRKNCEAIFGAFIPYAAISGRHATSGSETRNPTRRRLHGLVLDAWARVAGGKGRSWSLLWSAVVQVEYRFDTDTECTRTHTVTVLPGTVRRSELAVAGGTVGMICQKFGDAKRRVLWIISPHL